MSDEKILPEFTKIIDRAIVLCDRYVPLGDRAPTPGGGSVRIFAVGFLVAVRAAIEAALEHEKAKKEGQQ